MHVFNTRRGARRELIKEAVDKEVADSSPQGEGSQPATEEAAQQPSTNGAHEDSSHKTEKKEPVDVEKGEGTIELDKKVEEIDNEQKDVTEKKEGEEQGMLEAENGSKSHQLKTLSPESMSNSDSIGDSSDLTRHQHSSADELLAIMGGMHPQKRDSFCTVSESSGESLLSEHPCFLHIRVSHKCSAAHTYTPLNRSIGIDIPHNKLLSPAKGTLQQVKTIFCFAVAEKRCSQEGIIGQMVPLHTFPLPTLLP